MARVSLDQFQVAFILKDMMEISIVPSWCLFMLGL